jgi:polyisoprenyl-teichoic acid--peptidoglycan teichoic acid transferase
MSTQKKIFLFLGFITTGLIITLTACSVLGLPTSVNQSDSSVDWVLVTPDPNAQPTKTPFIPSARTPIPTVEPSPTPTQDPYVEFVPAQDQIIFLILGSDYRPMAGFRTDIIMLVGVNPKTNQVSVVSFPRDLCIYIPGTYSGYDLESCDRINTAMQHGFPTTANMFETNFGVRPDYYAMSNFQGFVALVDSLGGIEVNVGQYFSDVCHLPQAVNGYCSFSPGTTLMNGDTALWYVRSRYSTSDYDRERRSQEVIAAIFTRMVSLDMIAKIPAMFEIYKQYVETNIPLDVVLSLARVAASINLEEDVYREALAPPVVIDRMKSNGAQVSLPNQSLIAPIIQRAFFSD